MHSILMHFSWVLSGLIGLAVGLSELLNRYKSFEKIFNWYSALYMFINFLASVLVYFLFKIYHIQLGNIGNHEIGLVLVAGISAMGFLRSSFFNYKTSNDKVIEVGPAAFLNIFLNAAERQVDQTISQKNLVVMEEIMSGINFLSASKDLPIIILSTMRVLTNEEQKELSEDILKLVNDTNTITDVKNIALGVILLKYTGIHLLQQAVTTLKGIYAKETQKKVEQLNKVQQQLTKIV